ncbi:uncharacterized protein LOC121718904 isoform X2 [Alosa sapidissima]|uniref:uncharacterized protein LOC121718904 isoform X2 n=1 Tax=Alosa sapidissima TaxID=34773 RepID=UPI001C09C365|nr:uncharacterized protein LOC121718904 isoform X2 [Alosa sapidissima]
MGGNQCCVISCRAFSHDHQGRKLDNGLSFYRFPAWKQTGGTQLSDITKRRRMAWIAAVGRSDLTFDKIPVSMKVCSRHFQSGQPANDMLEEDADWVPHLLLKQDEPSEATTTTTTGAGGDGDELQELDEDNQNGETGGGGGGGGVGGGGERSECEFCSVRRDQINRLLAENQELRYELERRRFDELFLEEDDDKVRYYTGLQCFAVLMGILQHVLPHLSAADDDDHRHASATDTTSTTSSPSTTTPQLSPFQKLLLTLMRLRLDLPVGHLSHLFGVAPETVARVFHATVHALHAQLSPLVHWPERSSLLAAVPPAYASSLGHAAAAVVMLDCLEIPIQRPKSMKGREQTYSCQRHTYTMKYLVAMTPQGAIAFISPAIGGRATDMQVAEASGILERLSSGDYVLAERGFELKESAGVMCAQVKSSAFGKGRRQLDVKRPEETRAQVADVRAHLQQVAEAGRVQQHFMLLERMTVPVNMLLPPPSGGADQLPLLDKIITVCCALLNMCPNIHELSAE